MKRIFYMSLAALTLGISSCTNEELSDSSKVIGNDRIVVDLPGATTRTHMDETDRNKVLWTTGDEISIFSVLSNQYTNNKYTLSSGGNTQSGEFTGSVSKGSTKKAAFYPYVAGTTFDGSKISFNMSNNLTLDADKPTENNKAPMACIISPDAQDKISFKNAGALLDITVRNIPTEYKKIVLTSKGENAPSISGAMEIEFSDGDPTLKVAGTATTAASEDKTVAISFTLSVLKDLQFFFPIPAGTYPELSLTLYKDNESTGTELRSFKGDSDSGLTVAKGERLYATVIFDKVTGDIAASVNSTSDVKEALKESDAVSVTGEITGVSNTVTVPTATSGSTGETTKSLSLEKVASGASLQVSDENSSSGAPDNSVDNFILSIPNNETVEFEPLNVTITMPNTTVTLAGNAGRVTYGEVVAETAKNTLIIGENVTVKKLTVKQGNVRLKAGATIEQLVHDNGNTVVYLYHETDQYTLPNPLPKKFKIADAAIADMKKIFAEGGTYTLQRDMNIAEYKMTVPNGKEVTLNLNGKTLEAANNGNITVNGTFTLQDNASNGTIKATKDYGPPYTTGIIYVSGEDAKMTMKGGYISAVRTDPVSKGQFGIALWDGADLTIEGGKIEAGWYAVSGNGNHQTQNSIINITGGELISVADYAVYLPQAGTTTISGGIIKGACGAIGMRSGTLNINDQAKLIGEGTGDSGQWGDGTGTMGYAVINIGTGNQNTYGDCTVNITGGTFIAEGKSVGIAKPEDGAKHNITVSVTGGTFSDLSATDYIAEDGNVNIELNKDIILTKQIITKGTMTLNLNGKTLSNTTNIWNEETKTWSLISVQGKELTIKGDGKLAALKDDCYALDVRNNATLNIEGGEYVGNMHTVYVWEGVANIKGGEYSIQQLADGNKPYEFVLNCYDQHYKADPKKANVIVTGGTFHKFNPASNGAEGELNSTNFCPEGYTATTSDNGETYVVSSTNNR